MKRVLFYIGVLIALLGLTASADTLNWQNLHEEADATNSKDALIAAEKAPNNLDKLYVLALTYLNEHKDSQAKETFERMLEIDSQLPEAKWGVAEVLRRMYEIDESEKMLEDIIKNHSDYYPAYISLAYLRYKQKEYKKAVKLAKIVNDQGQENVDLSNYMRSYLIIAGAKGKIARNGGPIAKVIYGGAVMPNLKKAQELKSESAEVYYGLGSYYLLAPAVIGGSPEKAKEYLEKAIEKDPLFPNPYARLAEFYQMQGDEEQFNRYLNKALELDPKNPTALRIKEEGID